MGSVGPVVLLVVFVDGKNVLVVLVDGKNVATAQEKVLTPSYDVHAVGRGADAGVARRCGRAAAPTACWGAASGHAGDGGRGADGQHRGARGGEL